MNKTLYKDAFGWGIGLWFIGYALGFVLFMVVPLALIGWIILPVGILLTLWVLLKRVKPDTLAYYTLLAVIWTAIAVLFDYMLIVKLLKPVDGYYKLDVYLYYVLTFILPLAIGFYKSKKDSEGTVLKTSLERKV